MLKGSDAGAGVGMLGVEVGEMVSVVEVAVEDHEDGEERLFDELAIETEEEVLLYKLAIEVDEDTLLEKPSGS